MQKTAIIFVLVIMVLMTSQSRADCPQKCVCGVTTVNCSGLQLIQVPPRRNQGDDDVKKTTAGSVTSSSFFSNFVNSMLKALNVDVRGPRSVETLDLTRNNLTFMNGARFGKFRNLRELRLDYNEISEIRVYTPIKSLLNLSLSHNQLGPDLEKFTFGDLWKLQRLDLSYNSYRTIENRPFPDALQWLDISHNSIQTIYRNSFVNLYSLAYLDVRALSPNMDMSNLSDVMAPLEDAREIRISGARRGRLSSDTFDRMWGIEELELSSMALTSLPRLRRMFEQPEAMRSLRLGDNNLSRVPQLADLLDLNFIDLNSNRIVSLESSDFQMNRWLEEIDASANRIASIAYHVTDGLSSLQVFNLSGNVAQPSSLRFSLVMSNARYIAADFRFPTACQRRKRAYDDVIEAAVNESATLSCAVIDNSAMNCTGEVPYSYVIGRVFSRMLAVAVQLTECDNVTSTGEAASDSGIPIAYSVFPLVAVAVVIVIIVAVIVVVVRRKRKTRDHGDEMKNVIDQGEDNSGDVINDVGVYAEISDDKNDGEYEHEYGTIDAPGTYAFARSVAPPDGSGNPATPPPEYNVAPDDADRYAVAGDGEGGKVPCHFTMTSQPPTQQQQYANESYDETVMTSPKSLYLLPMTSQQQQQQQMATIQCADVGTYAEICDDSAK